MTQEETAEMTKLSQIPILDGEEWSLSEAIDRNEEQAENIQRPDTAENVTGQSISNDPNLKKFKTA